MATRKSVLQIMAEVVADTGLDPTCSINSDVTPGPFILSGWDDHQVRTITLGPAAADQAVTFTNAIAVILLSDKPFDLRVAAGETLLTGLRAFVLWGDDKDTHVHSISVLLTGNGTDTATISALIIEEDV